MGGALPQVGLRRSGLAVVVSLGFALTAAPALSQPGPSQIGAVKQNCRSDYMAHCSSVPPGGAESLNCLQNNSARLSASCRSAVDALKPAAAAPKPAAAPPPAPAAAPVPERATAPARAPAAATAPPAQQQPRTQVAKPPPSRQAPPPRTAAAPAEPAWVYVPMPPLLPRVQLGIVRACDGDRQAVCSMVPLGGGRVIECLARNEPSLTPFCRQTIQSARASAAR